MRVCGNHWKWLQLRSCKIWYDSVRNKRICLHQNYFLKRLKISLLGLSTLKAPNDGAMDVLPPTLKKKKSPTWYMAEISTMGYEESFDYVGRSWEGWCYDTY